MEEALVDAQEISDVSILLYYCLYYQREQL